MAPARKRKPEPPARKSSPGLTRRAFARKIGVSEAAVRKGIASGRLARSVMRSGCLDADLAAKEWTQGATKPNPDGRKGPTLTEAQFRLTTERATGLKIDNDKKRGRLIESEVARREAFECARAVRDAVLNIPDRVAAELAAESDGARVHARLDEELRRALETVAEVLAHGE